MAEADVGIDVLLEELRERCRREATGIRHAAEEEAERIVVEARREAEEERQRALRNAEEALRTELAAERDREENEVREQVMVARHELLERVRSRALELLEDAANSDAYRRQLRAWIREARACLPAGGEVVLRCPPSLEEAIRDALSGMDGDVRVELDPAVGAGFRASTPGGTLTADATLARRLERDWSELTRVVLEELEERWAETGDR